MTSPDDGRPELSVEPTYAADDHAVPERVESAQLLGSARELVIVHRGREYRLRVTQNGKLILTA